MKLFSNLSASSGAGGILLLVFLAALVPRAAIVLLAPHQPWQHWDAAHDVLIARNLAEGHGFVNEPGHPTAYRYPLLPVVLSLFFRVFSERYIPFMLFQALLGALTAAFIAWFGYKALGRKVALVSGLLVAFNTELISISRMMLTETMFAFLVCLAGVVFVKIFTGGKALLVPVAGIILGLAALCRPVAAVWGFLLGLVFLFHSRIPLKKRFISLLIASLAALCTISPWLVRNCLVFGEPLMNTAGGVTLWDYGHNDALRGDSSTVVPEEYRLANDEARPREYFLLGEGDPSQMAVVFSMQPRYQAYSREQSVVDRLAGLDEIEADRELYEMALEYIRENPLETLRHSMENLFKSFAYTEMNGKMNVVLTLIMPFLLLGAVHLWRSSRAVALVVLTSVVSMLAIHFVFYFDHRFRVPYQPFIMLTGAAGFLRAWQGNLSTGEKLLLYGFMAVPVAVNYFLIWGIPSG